MARRILIAKGASLIIAGIAAIGYIIAFGYSPTTFFASRATRFTVETSHFYIISVTSVTLGGLLIAAVWRWKPNPAFDKRLYKSVVAILALIGAGIVGTNVVLAAHDSIRYRQLPPTYRQAIEHLERTGQEFRQLPVEYQEAIYARHDIDLPAAWPDSLVARSVVLVLSDLSRRSVLARFNRDVPRWGSQMHQRQPVRAIAQSLPALLPLVLFVGISRWIKWLLTPEDVATENQ